MSWTTQKRAEMAETTVNELRSINSEFALGTKGPRSVVHFMEDTGKGVIYHITCG